MCVGNIYAQDSLESLIDGMYIQYLLYKTLYIYNSKFKCYTFDFNMFKNRE